MNVAPLKTGKPGRPAFRRLSGKIFSTGLYVAFLPDDHDLFGDDLVLLYTPLNFPKRAKDFIDNALHEYREIEVVLAFSGVSRVVNGKTFYDCRFVAFPWWVK